MSIIEYRVRAVTRYIVTRAEKSEVKHNSVDERGEFDSLELAETVAIALFNQERYHMPEEGKEVTIASSDKNVTYASIAPVLPKVRTKFVCTSSVPYPDLENGGHYIQMSAVWDGAAEDGGNSALENRIFAKWTPSAYITMQIVNPDGYKVFKPGENYYVDFFPIPKTVDIGLANGGVSGDAAPSIF